MAKLLTEKIFRYESKDGLHVTVTDMGELVRCKDCKHADEYHHCTRLSIWQKPDDYCSYGARMEAEE